MDAPSPHRTWLDQLALVLGTGLYVGSIPPKLGTLGALWGIPLTWALAPLPWPIRVAALAILWLLGVWVSGHCQRLLQCKDPKEVVIDEYVTVPIVYLFAPSLSVTWLVVGFVLHRIFDITKVLGIRQLEALPGGWGVMADDLLASVYAMGVLAGLAYLLH